MQVEFTLSTVSTLPILASIQELERAFILFLHYKKSKQKGGSAADDIVNDEAA